MDRVQNRCSLSTTACVLESLSIIFKYIRFGAFKYVRFGSFKYVRLGAFKYVRFGSATPSPGASPGAQPRPGKSNGNIGNDARFAASK